MKEKSYVRQIEMKSTWSHMPFLWLCRRLLTWMSTLITSFFWFKTWFHLFRLFFLEQICQICSAAGSAHCAQQQQICSHSLIAGGWQHLLQRAGDDGSLWQDLLSMVLISLASQLAVTAMNGRVIASRTPEQVMTVMNISTYLSTICCFAHFKLELSAAVSGLVSLSALTITVTIME
jgi:hypothetical protein